MTQATMVKETIDVKGPAFPNAIWYIRSFGSEVLEILHVVENSRQRKALKKLVLSVFDEKMSHLNKSCGLNETYWDGLNDSEILP